MRLSITFEGKAEERLSRLTAATGEAKSEVLRQALALEDIYQEAVKRGAAFIIKERDGSEREIVRA